MHRRDFLTGTLTGAAALGVTGTPLAAGEGKAPTKGRMKAGHQGRSSDADLRYLSALGVGHICSALPSRAFDDNWSVEALGKLRERVEGSGIKLDMVPLPLSSSPIGRAEYPSIMLGKGPERDRDIGLICKMIRNIGRAGIPAAKYNLTLLGVVRTAPTKGRGGARYSTFVYERAKDRDGPPPPESGPVGEKQMWERITYFLEKVIPV
ncbi:MAG TPA: mannonate dehydratase, partial [Gemmataceae bacterium]|nr:mannonate dehydratase [Gemmataceae bacterium]